MPRRRTRCVFHTPIQRTDQSTRLSTLESPKVGVEESGPSATAPHGVQLQALINWMLRFHVGNPREFHHLRLRGSPMKTSASPAQKRGKKKKVQYLCPESATSSRLPFGEKKKTKKQSTVSQTVSISTNALNVHDRQHLTLSWHGATAQMRVFILHFFFLLLARLCLCSSKSFPHASSSYWTEAGQMSAHNTAPGAEGSLERFIVKCALTFGAVGVRPFFYIPPQEQTVG